MAQSQRDGVCHGEKVLEVMGVQPGHVSNKTHSLLLRILVGHNKAALAGVTTEPHFYLQFLS
jgi:hypothetical protein